ncbi:MAG: hypothetical protein B7C54_11685 [Acidimicrobiales bacterium mtb01]|nr:hypothetical protein [Actinomycetota bacterium]TEX45708.1 MAG: hypothetical protein B7C54_11685 [Acidimicrobiales bacterium mtb01]
MDPTATVRIMRDTDNEFDERIDAARDLIAWLHGGGFTPAGEDRVALLDEAGRLARPAFDVAPDEHLEAAYEDRFADDEVWS